MGLGRKGVFLSLSAILIVGVLFVVFAPTSQRDLETGSRLHAQEIVSQVNALETNELDVWLEYVSRSALNILAEGVESGRYIERENFAEVFRACVFSGPGSVCRNVESLETPTELLADLAEFYDDELGHEDVSIELIDVNIGELGARSVIVQGTFVVNLTNSANRLSVQREVQRDIVISLEGLRDPLAARHGINQRFRFVSVIGWNLESVFQHAGVEETTYVLTSDVYPGVLYFDRFSDNPPISYNQTVHFLLPPSTVNPRTSHIDFQRIPDDTHSPDCLLELYDSGASTAGRYVYIDPLFSAYYGIYDPASDINAARYHVRFEGECD